MSKKVTIVGAGSVGSTIAFMMAVKGLASEVVLIDINEAKALGEALDIRQGTPLCDTPISIYAGSYADAKDSDVVIITSGVPRKPGQTRIDLCQTNVNILKSIASNIVEHAPNAYYIIVSNRVDILSYVFQKVTGVSEKKVIGSGTLLDSARLRSRIAEYLNVSQKNVHAYVFGEHGETSFIPWSIAQVSTIDLFDYKELIKFDNKQMVDLDYDAIEKYMRTSGSKVIQRKGATFYAIAISVCSICEYLFGAVDVVTTVSTMMHGEYGIEDVCLSIPTLLGPNGVEGKVTPKLTDEEVAKLRYSADSLKEVISKIQM